MKIYWDFHDWWIGLYVGPNHLYFCPLPCLVVRFEMNAKFWHRLRRHEIYPQMSGIDTCWDQCTCGKQWFMTLKEYIEKKAKWDPRLLKRR